MEPKIPGNEDPVFITNWAIALKEAEDKLADCMLSHLRQGLIEHIDENISKRVEETVEILDEHCTEEETDTIIKETLDSCDKNNKVAERRRRQNRKHKNGPPPKKRKATDEDDE